MLGEFQVVCINHFISLRPELSRNSFSDSFFRFVFFLVVQLQNCMFNTQIVFTIKIVTIPKLSCTTRSGLTMQNNFNVSSINQVHLFFFFPLIFSKKIKERHSWLDNSSFWPVLMLIYCVESNYNKENHRSSIRWL